MDWLEKIRSIFPVTANINVTRAKKTLVLYNKTNIFELETCIPKGIIRERSWGRTDRIDLYHLRKNGTIKITLGN